MGHNESIQETSTMAKHNPHRTMTTTRRDLVRLWAAYTEALQTDRPRLADSIRIVIRELEDKELVELA